MGSHQHHENFDPGSLYKEKWVQDLIRQLQDFTRENRSWLGLGDTKEQRILDYACGNGAISAALVNVCPHAIFQGIDILPAQVGRFNDQAMQLLGDGHSRMFAIAGDLTKPSSDFEDAKWFEFDVAIISMALHHIADPVDMLRRLGQRVKSGGTIVVAEWLNDIPRPGGENKQKEPYHHTHNHNPVDMMETIGGQTIWSGFTRKSMQDCMEAAGLKNVEIKLQPKVSKMPENLGGDKQIFYAKAYVA